MKKIIDVLDRIGKTGMETSLIMIAVAVSLLAVCWHIDSVAVTDEFYRTVGEAIKSMGDICIISALIECISISFENKLENEEA